MKYQVSLNYLEMDFYVEGFGCVPALLSSDLETHEVMMPSNSIAPLLPASTAYMISEFTMPDGILSLSDNVFGIGDAASEVTHLPIFSAIPASPSPTTTGPKLVARWTTKVDQPAQRLRSKMLKPVPLSARG